VRSARPSIAPLLLPVAAIGVFVVFVGASVAVAAGAGTLGFDFLAYHEAGRRILDGHQLYDLSIHRAGGFGLFYYPPPFALLVLPFALLAPSIATWLWTAAIVAAFFVGVALMPVRGWVRWATILLAGLSWPFAYAVKLGQVGPILFLLFAIGWRWMDRPRVLGTSIAVGALIKIQPGLLLLWAAASRRLEAVAVAVAVGLIAVVVATLPTGGTGTWLDYLTMLRNVTEPITTPHNFTAGAIAYQLGAGTSAAAVIQLTVSLLVISAVVISARIAEPAASYLIAVIASQLLSPVLWDHYALLLLLPAAWLLDRGRRWAVVIPLATSTLLISVTPPAAYPIAFCAALVAVFAVGTSRRRSRPRSEERIAVAGAA
jgi:glycosyl transferase family 87